MTAPLGSTSVLASHLTLSHRLCCSSSGASPMATQDRLAPGSSVGLSEFGALFSVDSCSHFVLDLIVVADDHCCRCQATAVIRFSDRIQPRSPPGKHWAPFVRGCVPAGSDPGHDKGRLANHDAVNQALRGVVRLRKTVKGGLSVPRLAPCQAPSSLFSFQ